MSARAAYLQRADRGDALTGIRLVGPHTDDAWTAPAESPESEFGPDAVTSARHAAAEGATWLAASLRDGRNTLAALCIDTEGTTCTWLDAPARTPQVVAAAYAQIRGGESTALLASPELSAVEAMDGAAINPEAATTRLGVIATPDSVPRLLLDELDQRGVEAGRVVSIWQAVAETWDPSGPASQLARAPERDGEIVAGDAPITAVVMIEPRGRLLWVWSRSGRPLAAGSIRLAGADGSPIVTRADAARLAADFIAWSAQCAEAPARALCITTELARDDETALSPSAFGELLGEALPGASVQMTVESDPIGETLARLTRLADETDPIGEGITVLSRAPGRAHRSLYNWASIALLAGAAVVVTLAWRADQRVADVREAQVAERARQDQLLVEGGRGEFVGDPFAIADLQSEVNKIRGARPSTGPDRPVRPILQELGAIATAIKSASQFVDVRPESIKLNTLTTNVEFWVPDAAAAFDVKTEIDVFREQLDWDAPQPSTNTRERDGKLKFQVSGNWPRDGIGS